MIDLGFLKWRFGKKKVDKPRICETCKWRGKDSDYHNSVNYWYCKHKCNYRLKNPQLSSKEWEYIHFYCKDCIKDTLTCGPEHRWWEAK